MLKYRAIKMHKRTKKSLYLIFILIGAIIAIAAIAFFAIPGCTKTLPVGQTAEVTIEEGSST